MSRRKKPKKRLIALLPGSEIHKPESLARFYSRITSKPLTEEMVAEFRRLLDEELGKAGRRLQ